MQSTSPRVASRMTARLGLPLQGCDQRHARARGAEHGISEEEDGGAAVTAVLATR